MHGWDRVSSLSSKSNYLLTFLRPFPVACPLGLQLLIDWKVAVLDESIMYVRLCHPGVSQHWPEGVWGWPGLMEHVSVPSTSQRPVPPWLDAIGIKTWDDAAKVTTVTCFCFTANTILLLGRNIGATLLLTGIGAEALPYSYVLVGLFIMVIMPVVASAATKYSSGNVLVVTTFVMIVILSVFTVLFVTGVADEYPKIVYPLFFVLEEVIDSLLMVLFWQIGMLCFTKDQAKRLIGIVNMGAAAANLANGVTVAILIHFFDSFAILPAQMVLLLIQLIPNYICRKWTGVESQGGATDDVSKGGAEQGAEADQVHEEKLAWWQHPLTQMIAVWQFITVLLFSCIEYQYNSTLANFLDANGIAQVTANLASVASAGQVLVNLAVTPFLLQNFGVWAALLVTPSAYILGESLVISAQTVTMVFICRSMDFIFRYTVSDNTKQILYKSVPPSQLIEARAFTDGTIKKLGPMLLGGILIVVQVVTHAKAYEIVYPMAFAALLASIGLMPLVLRLARMSESQDANEKSLM